MASPAYEQYRLDEEGKQLLDRMMHHNRRDGAFDPLMVPVRVRPEVAAKFLTENVKAPLQQWIEARRAGEIARFYNVTEVAGLFVKLLDHQEKSADDLCRSIECLVALGELGDEELQKQATGYLDHIAAHQLLEKVLQPAVQCLFYLPQKATPQKLLDRIRQFTQQARASAGSPAEGEENASRWEEYSEAEIPLVLHAREHRLKLLAEKDPAERSVALARLYLGLDAPGNFPDWHKWAALRLMRETFQDKPEPRVTGIRSALAAIPDSEPQEYKDHARGRGVKAILFFKGSLDAQEQRWYDADRTPRFQLQG
ncbi:MAG: hypothetical protein ABFE13_15460 [Phycisphaerales bacterium]